MGLFGPKPLRALIVEDDAALRAMIGVFFQGWGVTVLEAGDGDQGLALARSEKPDIVILDIMLPGISGMAVLETLRAAPEGEGVPIIMCTALRALEDVERALEAGADDYIQKPFDADALHGKVSAALAKYGKKLPP